MKSFEYHAPRTRQEAVALLGSLPGGASLLAGGTDLLVEIKENLRRPECLIDLANIPGLNELSYDPVRGLSIGAMVTVNQVAASPVVGKHYPALAYAAGKLGSPQVRNLATVAGNICRAAPSADTPPPLIAADAVARLYGPAGEREVALEDFFSGPGHTVLAKDEMLTGISAPSPQLHTGAVYLKHGRRKAMELAMVGVAVSVTLHDGVCSRVRIVLGAVAPTPMRALKAEKMLLGGRPDRAALEAAAQSAGQESKPISDVRSSADYRREMVGVLTERALIQAVALAEEA